MRDLKKVLLTAGAVAAVGVTASVGTFAGFTDSEQNTDNVFDAGTVAVALEGSTPTGPALEIRDLVPGDSAVGKLVVENAGDNKATFTVGADGTGDSTLAERLQVVIKDGATEVYNGSVADLNDPVSEWDVVLDHDGTRTYDIALSFPSDANDNDLQGLSVTETFVVDAVQRDAATDRANDTTVSGDNPAN